VGRNDTFAVGTYTTRDVLHFLKVSLLHLFIFLKEKKKYGTLASIAVQFLLLKYKQFSHKDFFLTCFPGILIYSSGLFF